MDVSLWRLFQAVSQSVAERDAIVGARNRSTYAQLFDRSIRFSNVLAARDLGTFASREKLAPWESGQHLVGTYLLNSPEYLEVTMGSFAARAAPFNVNYRYVADELAYLLNDASTSALVYHARFSRTVADVLPRLTRKPLLLQVADESGHDLLTEAIDYHAALADAAGALAVDGHSGDDLYVLYTGGTTGMPKGTLWRQADIWTAALGGDRHPLGRLNDVLAEAARRPHRVLPNAPFMHGAAQWFALRTLLSGGTIVLNGVVDHLDPADVWRRVEHERVGSLLMVGEAFARPLLHELERGTYDVSSVRIVYLGGAATSPETKTRVVKALPGARVHDSAGSSEMGSALGATSSAGSIGPAATFDPGPGTVVLNSNLTGVVRRGSTERGWLAKSGAIPLGYLGDEAKTRQTFPSVDGTRYSVPGDRARLLDDGAIKLLGRESQTVNSGGEKIFVEEVEAAIMAHPSVRDAVVVGRRSERWGQEVVAVVELASGVHGISDEELVASAAERIARYKLPKAIKRVDQIVRSPAGKADYRWALRQAQDS